MPEVSVILPAYNHEKYIAQTLQSILQQNFQNIEIIIIDDGSKDDTVKIVKEFFDPRIRLIRFTENQGISVALNCGIREASGKYIAIAHSDDILMPQKISKQVQYLEEHPDVGAVFTHVQIINEEGNEFNNKDHFYYGVFDQPNRTRHQWLNHFFYQGNCLCHPSLLMRKTCFETVGYYDERLAQLEDFDYWIRLCSMTEIHIIPEKLLQFRVRDNEENASGNRPQTRIRCAIEMMQVLRQFTKIKDTAELFLTFPQAKRPISAPDNVAVPFMIAWLAFETPSRVYKCFAISILNELLGDHQKARIIETDFHFGYSHLIALTGETDILMLAADEQIAALTQTVTERNDQVTRLSRTIAERDEQYTAIITSRSWRMTALLRSGGQLARFVYWKINELLCTLVLMKPYCLKAVNNPKWAFSAIKRGYSIISKSGIEELKIRIKYKHITPSVDLAQYSRKIFILYTSHTFFVARLLEYGFTKLGIGVELVSQQPERTFGDDLYIVICPQMFKFLPRNMIAFQMEQSVSDRWFTAGYINTLKKSIAVLDYSIHNIEYLQQKGLLFRKIFLLPLGIIPDYQKKCFQKDVIEAKEEVEYDIAFYGDVNNERRKMYLSALSKKFKVQIIGNLFGEELYKELITAKIVVNIHYYEKALLETTRIFECLSLGLPVVSEVSTDIDDHLYLSNSVLFVEAGNIEGMVVKIEQLLNDSNELDRIKNNIKNIQKQNTNRFLFFLSRFLFAHNLLPFEKISLENDILPGQNAICLSLPESTRRYRFSRNIDNGSCISYAGIKHYTGWIGCALSYKLIIAAAKKANLPQVLVMEDDVVLSHDYRNKLHIVNKYLDNLSKKSCKWHVFSGMIAHLHEECEILAVEEFEGIMFVHLNKMTSMVLNIYNNSSYDIISGWDHNNQNINNTIDRYLEQQPSLRVITTLPFLVGHNEDLDSTLWGFNNSQYNPLIQESERLLASKVQEFSRKRAHKKYNHFHDLGSDEKVVSV